MPEGSDLDARRWLRRAARLTGGVAAGFWVLALVGSLIAEESVGEADARSESVAIVVLVLLNVVGVAVAFRRERLGGALVVATGTAFSLFALASAGHNHALAMLVSGGPFLVSGLLFLAASRR